MVNKWIKLTSMSLLILVVLSACGKEKDIQESEAGSQSSTIESTERGEEKESIIKEKTATDYDTIYVQNSLIIAQTGDDSSYNWTIYDTDLKEKIPF